MPTIKSKLKNALLIGLIIIFLSATLILSYLDFYKISKNQEKNIKKPIPPNKRIDKINKDKKEFRKLIKKNIRQKILKYSLEFNKNGELEIKKEKFEYLFFKELFDFPLKFKKNNFKFFYANKNKKVKIIYFKKEKIFQEFSFKIKQNDINDKRKITKRNNWISKKKMKY